MLSFVKYNYDALGIEPLFELFFFGENYERRARTDPKEKASGESPARRERPKDLLW